MTASVFSKEWERKYGAPLLDQKFWNDRGRWPRGTAEFVFVGDAILLVGQAMHGEDWDGNELAVVVPPPPPSLLDASLAPPAPVRPITSLLSGSGGVASVRQQHNAHVTAYNLERATQRGNETRAKNRRALERLRSVLEWIAAEAHAGRLETRLRLKTTSLGAAVYMVPHPGLWDTEPIIERRFKAGSFTALVPGMRQAVEVFPFFTRASLTRCIATLGHAATERDGGDPLAGLSPYLRFAVALARKFEVFSRNGQMSEDAMIANAQEEWARANAGEALSKTAAEAIAKVVRHHDPIATKLGGQKKG